MTKAEARKHFRQQRRQLPEQTYRERNDALVRHARQLVTRLRPALVHSFLPILKQKEVNTWPLIEWLWSQNTGVAVSRSSLSDNRLQHFRCESHTSCRENAWGIPEPVGDDLQQVTVSEIDLVLVPLLAFDRSGQRVGYGKGYYDRFLSECPDSTVSVGLSLFEAMDEISDLHEGDVALHYVISPLRIHSFSEMK